MLDIENDFQNLKSSSPQNCFYATIPVLVFAFLKCVAVFVTYLYNFHANNQEKEETQETVINVFRKATLQNTVWIQTKKNLYMMSGK
jgi:hypothetical protein